MMCTSCCLCVKGERGEQGEVGPVGARGGPVSTPTAGDNLQHARSKSPCMISLEVLMGFEKTLEGHGAQERNQRNKNE